MCSACRDHYFCDYIKDELHNLQIKVYDSRVKVCYNPSYTWLRTVCTNMNKTKLKYFNLRKHTHLSLKLNVIMSHENKKHILYTLNHLQTYILHVVIITIDNII